MYDSSLTDILTRSIEFLDRRYDNIKNAVCFSRNEPYTYDCVTMSGIGELQEEWINQSGSNGFPNNCSFCASDIFDPTTGCNVEPDQVDPGGIGCGLTGLENSSISNLTALFSQYVSPFNQVPSASSAPVCAGCSDHGQMIPTDQPKCNFVDIVEDIYAASGGTPYVYNPGGDNLQVFTAGADATTGLDQPGVFVGTMYQSNWNSAFKLSNSNQPFGVNGLQLPTGSLEGFGSPAVRVYGKTELRDGADFSDGSVTCGPDCIEGIVSGQGGMLPHDRYDIIHIANPVRVGVVVKDTALCNCLQQELGVVDMEWNQTGDWMPYDGGRIGTVVNGYRYNTDGDTGNRKRKFSTDDQISTIPESFSGKWSSSTKWKVRVQDLGQKSGDLIGNLLPGQTGVLTPDEGIGAGPGDTFPGGEFALNDSTLPDTIAARWYHDPLGLGPNLGAGNAIGICSATGVFVAGNDQFNRVFADGGNNGIQVPNLPALGDYQTYLLCNGNPNTIYAAVSAPTGQIPNFDGLLNDGRCDTAGNCIKDASSGAGACSFTGNNFAPFYLPPTPCRNCTSPFTRTLPVGYGSAVDGFIGVSPRSSAFSDYVSNSFFRDNYANESQTDFGQLFMGYYLARKIVDGECVTMLCPEDSNSDNYCKALRDCN